MVGTLEIAAAPGVFVPLSRRDRAFHRDTLEADRVRQRDWGALGLAESVRAGERLAREVGHQREHGEALVAGGPLAAVEDRAPQPLAGPVGAYEHRPHARRLGRRVEQPRVAGGFARARVELVA